MGKIFDQNNNVRILRPKEVDSLRNAIPKRINLERFDAMLYTGCRYTELQEVQGKRHRLDGNFLRIKNTKARVNDKYRYVRLNNPGVRAIDYFLTHKKKLPHYVTMDENLKRWADKAGIDSTGISIKTTRKTLESWLTATYNDRVTEILLSMGHTANTSIVHYLGLPFTEYDKRDMLRYIEGWIQ